MGTDADKTGPDLIGTFYRAGILSQNIFSFALRSTSQTSYLDMGQVDESKMANPADLVNIPVVTEKNNWWTSYLSGVRFGESQENAFGFLVDQKAFTDSGTSCTLIPTDFYDLFFEELEK